MISLRVDVDKDKCDKAYAYISDYLKQKIYVYRSVQNAASEVSVLNEVGIFFLCSYEANRMWPISHFYLNNDKKFGIYKVDGVEFEWFDGIFSVALGRRSATTGYRTAYFHPLSRYCYEHLQVDSHFSNFSFMILAILNSKSTQKYFKTKHCRKTHN